MEKFEEKVVLRLVCFLVVFLVLVDSAKSDQRIIRIKSGSGGIVDGVRNDEGIGYGVKVDDGQDIGEKRILRIRHRGVVNPENFWEFLFLPIMIGKLFNVIILMMVLCGLLLLYISLGAVLMSDNPDISNHNVCALMYSFCNFGRNAD